MQKYLYLAVLALLLIWSSCGDQQLDEISIPTGEEYIDNNSNVFYTDTFTLGLSNVLQDSLSTSGSEVALVGSFTNEEFGSINAESVFRITAPTLPVLDIEDDVFDSITICFDYNSYYIGDTAEVFNLSLHRVTTDLISDAKSRVLNDIQFGYYNTTTVEYEETALMNYSFNPRPVKSADFELKLDDNFGLDLFTKIANKDFNDPGSKAFDKNRFYDYLQGLVLKGNTETNKSILGFIAKKDNLYLKLYYNGKKAQSLELDLPSIIFKMEESLFQFNSIKSDRSETILSSLLERKEDISSVSTNNRAYLQGGTGLLTKVKFPSLQNVFLLNNLNTIIKAELVMVPVKDIDKLNDLPSSLILYNTNRINKNLGAVTVGTNVLPMVLNIDRNDYETQYYYSIDITQQLINELIDGEYDPEFSFLVGLPSSSEKSTVTSLIFGGENSNKNYAPKLKLYTYKY